MSLPRRWYAICYLLLGLILISPARAQEPAKVAEPTPNPFAQGMQLYYERDLANAAAKFKEAAESGGPEGAVAYAWLSRLELMLHQTDNAAASASRALQLDKDLPAAESAEGEVLYRHGKLSEAQEIFRRIALADKPDARAYLGLAKIHWATGNYLSAKQVIDRAHNLAPHDPEIFWRWFATLDAAEQLAAVRAELATASNPNAKQTADLKRAIEVREEKEKRPPSSCKLISAANSTEIKLDLVLNGPRQFRGYALPVKLNDSKAMLDVNTGTEGIVISARVAEKAGLQRFSENRFTGIRDYSSTHANRGYAAKLTLGDLQFQDCYVQVVDHLHFPDEDGLIGTNLLQDFLIDLDFPDKTLRLAPLEALPDIPPADLSLHTEMPIKPNPHNRVVPEKYANFQKVYRIGRDLLVPTRVNDSEPKLFFLQTAGWDNYISLPFAREVSKVSNTVSPNVYKTDDVTLGFGSVSQRRQTMLAFDMTGMSNDAETEVSGIIGFAMLSFFDLKLDYRDHLVSLTLGSKYSSEFR